MYQPECDSLEITSSGMAGQKHPKAMGTYKLIPVVSVGESSPLFKHTYNEYYLYHDTSYDNMAKKYWKVIILMIPMKLFWFKCLNWKCIATNTELLLFRGYCTKPRRKWIHHPPDLDEFWLRSLPRKYRKRKKMSFADKWALWLKYLALLEQRDTTIWRWIWWFARWRYESYFWGSMYRWNVQ